MHFSVAIKKQFTSGQTPFALDVTFTVQAGITVLFGPSGSGKSTTLNCIAGIHQPDSGHIQLGNRVLFESNGGSRPKINLALRERRVGYVFQHLGLFEHLRVIENVAYGLAHLPKTAAQPTAQAMLDQFGIGNLADRFPSALSGGERQRVALARTLVVRPEILLLDEPLSALDSITKRSLIDDLLRLRQELKIPILYVSHNLDEVKALGEQVFVFDRGKIVFEGKPGEILSVPDV